MVFAVAFLDGVIGGKHQGQTGKEKTSGKEDQDKEDRDLAFMLFEIVFCNKE
jgi:hypothetical protein